MTGQKAILRRARRALACASFYFFASFVHAASRPIPEVVNVEVFARPDGNRLELLVRMPLAAIPDIQFPTRGDADTLDLPALKSMLPGAGRYWVAGALPVDSNGQPLPAPEVADTRISISADESFNAYDTARARFEAPDLPADERVFWQQVWFDVRLLYTLPPGTPHLTVTPRLASLGVRVLSHLTVVTDSGSRTLTFEGDPGAIPLAPRVVDALRQFVARGARLVATSADFLLLLFCLTLPFRRYRQFLPVLVTFTAALSLTLIADAAGLTPRAVWFSPLVEVLATLAVLLAALANIAGRVTPRRRALFGLGAGLVFGGLAATSLEPQLQFGGPHVLISEAAFALGLLATTGAVVVLLVPLLGLVFSFARVEPIERIIVSALAADTAWGWLAERWTRLRRIPFDPTFDGRMLSSLLGVLAVLVLLGGLMWFLNEWLKTQRYANEEVAPERLRGVGEPAP